MSALINLEGKKFGKLTVIKRAGSKKFPSRTSFALWLCSCECGKTKTILSQSLVYGKTKSCGCLHKEKVAKVGTAARNVYRQYACRARQKNLAFAISFEQFLELMVSPCTYCGRVGMSTMHSKAGEVFNYNGVDRVDNLKGYIEGNTESCCHDCNMMKRNSSQANFLLNCKLIVSHRSL
jgi:hypothetical protein